MKLKTSITVAAILLAVTTGAAYAGTKNADTSGNQPQEITRNQAEGHEKIDSITVTQ